MAHSLSPPFAVTFDFVMAPGPRLLPPVDLFKIRNGTAGDDALTGTNKADTFNLQDGGDDTASGRNGDDDFLLGASLTATDAIDGGDGSDTLILDGNYSSMLVFAATTMRNVETLHYTGGHSYSLTLDNANVTLGQSLHVSGVGLGAGDALVFDGSDETSSALFVSGGFASDTIIGGGGNDQINPGPGNDTVNGGDGDDGLIYGANFNASDRADGGDGFDTLVLSGDYGAGVNFTALTMRNVERLLLASTNNYVLTLHNLNVGVDQTLTIDGTALALGNAMTIDGSAVEDGHLRLLGGGGEDALTFLGGTEAVIRAGGGNDSIFVAGLLEETDRINGGDGNDTVFLNGDYSDKFAFASQTLRNVETISLAAGHDYYLATSDGTLAAGATLIIDGTGLAGGELRFDGSEESNGTLDIRGGSGGDDITGGAADDVINAGGGFNFIDASRGGNDTIVSSGADVIYFGDDYGFSETVTTQANDAIILEGDYVIGLGIQYELPYSGLLTLMTGHSYSVRVDIPDAQHMELHASTLTANDRAFFTATGTGTCEAFGGDGNDHFVGGDGADTLRGGDGNDTLAGGGDGDLIVGDVGKDTFVFNAASESTSINFDVLLTPNLSEDKLMVPNEITVINAALNTGTLSGTSEGTFNTDLIAALSGHLTPNGAIIFTPDAGTLQNRHFLVVDLNGVGNYQVGSDLVIEIPGFTGTLGISDFI